VVFFGGFLAKLEFSRGFLYVCIFYIAGKISAAVMTGDIIFFMSRCPLKISLEMAHYVVCLQKKKISRILKISGALIVISLAGRVGD
jgi:hypothetical protein